MRSNAEAGRIKIMEADCLLKKRKKSKHIYKFKKSLPKYKVENGRYYSYNKNKK